MIKKELNIPMGTKLDLVALAVKSRAIRCKILSSGVPVTFKPVRYEVEGEILTVLTGKIWTYRKTHYMSGVVLENRIDIPALNLKPLESHEIGVWDRNRGDSAIFLGVPIYELRGRKKTYQLLWQIRLLKTDTIKYWDYMCPIKAL